MASSGWQTQKNIYTYSSNVTFIGNVNIQSVTRSGTSVTITGQIKFGARGTSGYYVSYNYGVVARPGAGSYTKILSNGATQYVGSSYDKTINFTRTLTVDASATTATLTVNYKACLNSDCSSTYWTASPTWTIDIDNPVEPAAATVSNVSTTWNSVTGTVAVSNWSELTDPVMRMAVTEAPYTTASMNGRRTESATSSPEVMTVSNSSAAFSYGALNILGCGNYYVGTYINANGFTKRSNGGAIYTAPAPVSMSYTQASSTTWTISLVGVEGNNNSTYDTANLTRTLRYKIGNGAWTYIDNDAQKTIPTVTTATITIAAGQTATVEGWMEYHDVKSEVSTFTITNGSPVVHLYGSVSGQSKEIHHLYGSVNGRSTKITKLYASVGGVAKLIFQDT